MIAYAKTVCAWRPIALKLYRMAASRMQIVPAWPPVAGKVPLIFIHVACDWRHHRYNLDATGGHSGRQPQAIFACDYSGHNRLAGRYDNWVPTWFLAPIDCSKIPALVCKLSWRCTEAVFKEKTWCMGSYVWVDYNSLYLIVYSVNSYPVSTPTTAISVKYTRFRKNNTAQLIMIRFY